MFHQISMKLSANTVKCKLQNSILRIYVNDDVMYYYELKRIKNECCDHKIDLVPFLVFERKTDSYIISNMGTIINY